ncbi:RIP metalloprotease RseP [Sphingomonas sp. AP4-R1]|uniref:RIP metalloprotease RseP n=1 Tax=Sphingomonas sp. AP4-R1 TaxID=2735134 RepID=UPI001493AF77|nr:RIP metalloprotease RseP [Sphingomonas sp. AP4-R1]QJU59562.1 RIP metalloprotease RseP [Sphingomonas sp. AP4-R1]
MTAIPNILLALFGFVVVIGPLVFLHELGHYFVGRWFGVHAETFSIGMGKELTGWTDKRGTRWRVSALPLGGYVKFAGDMGPAGRTDPAWLRLPAAEKARTFQGKPLWQRFLIVLAGPLTNFLIAIAIFAGFFTLYGVPQTPAVISGVVAQSAAEKAGIKPGDRIVAIDGRAISRFEDLAIYVSVRPGAPMALDVERGGRHIALSATPSVREIKDDLGNPQRMGLLGVTPGREIYQRMGPAGIIGAAVHETVQTVRTMVDVIGQIITGARPAKELGGPIQIARYSGETVSFGVVAIIHFMALISINLGFINLLPIPMLDGGHLLFYVIEGISRRPLPERAHDWAFRSGLAMLLGFMVFVTINDLGSLGLWRTLAGLIG